MKTKKNSDVGGKYFIDVRDQEKIDIYYILTAYGVTNPAVFHAVKKCLMAGRRGYKNKTQDLREAVEALQRGIELEELQDGRRLHREDLSP